MPWHRGVLPVTIAELATLTCVCLERRMCKVPTPYQSPVIRSYVKLLPITGVAGGRRTEEQVVIDGENSVSDQVPPRLERSMRPSELRLLAFLPEAQLRMVSQLEFKCRFHHMLGELGHAIAMVIMESQIEGTFGEEFIGLDGNKHELTISGESVTCNCVGFQGFGACTGYFLWRLRMAGSPALTMK